MTTPKKYSPQYGKAVRSALHKWGFAPSLSDAEIASVNSIYENGDVPAAAVGEIINARIDKWNARNVR